MANVTNVNIYYGASEVFTKNGTSTKLENDLNTLDISSISASTVPSDGIGYGICVTLEITFEQDDDENQSVTFTTVGMSLS